MSLELPPWLNADFLAAALQGGEAQEPRVTVRNFSATLAVAAGNNYMSRLYRVRVEYVEGEEDKSMSLIVKAPFTKGVLNKLVDETQFYRKEPKVYNELLPILNEIIDCRFGPRSFYNSVNNALVLSDLKEESYDMCDRSKQLDFPHCEQVLKTLAKFHAASVACKEEHLNLIKDVGKELFYAEGDKFDAPLKTWLPICLNIVAGIVGDMKINKTSEDFILSRAKTIGDSVIRLCRPKTKGLNVLNHGDLWVNNILFKHAESGDIVDVKFIDFQVPRYASPVIDLIYFIWSSANEDVRDSQLPDLIETYRCTLNSTLEVIGCEERLTKEELNEDLRDAIDWVIVTICHIVPVIISEAGDVATMEDIDDPEEVRDGQPDERFIKHMKSKNFRSILPKLMTHLQTWVSYYK